MCIAENKKMVRKIRIEGLDCATCAGELERKLNGIDGVKASVQFVNQTIRLECGSQQAYQEATAVIEGFDEVKIAEEENKRESLWQAHAAELLQVIFSAVFLVAGIVTEKVGTGNAALIAGYVLYGLAYLTVGWKILWETVKNIVHGRIFDENFLMTLASIGAIILGQYAEAAEVMVLYSLGELLQSIAVGASRKSIAALMDLKTETARVITEDGEKLIPPEEIRRGDLLLIKAGEKLATDGVIVEGVTTLDTRSLSGEAMPRDAGVGDVVLGGSINVGGVIKVRAEKDYSDSTVAKILDLVENSSAKKAKSEKFISKFAAIYTPVVCAAAVLLAFVAPVFTGNYVANLGDWVNRALVFLVISCPCALVISVPLSYFSGIGFAAKKGILVKGSTGLDALADTKIAAFDKTGTLTYGNFKIGEVQSEDKSELLKVLAAAEKGSSHPIAEAFSDIATPYKAEQITEHAGFGVSCTIDGKEVWVGNEKWMNVHSISVQKPTEGATCVYCAAAGKYLGYVTIEDQIKENVKKAVADLRKQGIEECYMLTGDNEARAQNVAEQIGLNGVYAELLPEDKLNVARELKSKGKLMYAGDGINDAPVLMEADVGISMGGVGSDAAIEASEVVLMRDDLSLLPLAKKIARRTKRIVLQNIVLSIAIKVVVMALGICNLIPLGLAVFADVGVMMLAVLNSFRTRIDFTKNRAESSESSVA